MDLKSQNLISNETKLKTKHDFDLLLKHICAKNDLNGQHHLIHMMNNELHDEDLNQILSTNSNQYSTYEW